VPRGVRARGGPPAESSFVRIIFQQRLTKAVDTPEGCSQVVGDRIRKGFKFLIGRGQLFRALLDTLFQLIVGLLQSRVALLEFATTCR